MDGVEPEEGPWLTRGAVLDQARDCVERDRAETHGNAGEGFAAIAALWSADLGIPLDEVDVARLMILYKAVRARRNPALPDNWIDIAGYASLGGELAHATRSASAKTVAVRVEVGEDGQFVATTSIYDPETHSETSDPAVADPPPAPGAEEEASTVFDGADEAPSAVIDDAPPAFAADGAKTESSAERGESSLEEIGAENEGVAPTAGLSVSAPVKKMTAEPDSEEWGALVARVLAGESSKDVAEAAGVKPAQLRGKIGAAQLRAKRMATALEREASSSQSVPIKPEAAKASPLVSKAKAAPKRPPAAEWSPSEDISVLRGVGQGRSSYAVSQKLKGRTATDVAARFTTLVPRSSAVAVAEALREAQARHAEARGRAAE